MKLSFNVIRQKLNQQKPETKFLGTVLALDPGETTGVAAFGCTDKEATLVHAGQIKTWPIQDCVHNLTKLLDDIKPDFVVFELYAVYEWKSDSHSWSQIPTVQVIGSLQTLLVQRNIPWTSQTAQVAKNFCKDEKLEEWGFWLKGLRHARDAIRHGCYFLLFGPKKDS